ncbi:MAG: L-serine ammonia-lyase, iron-sulfur-dependent subunit beta [Bacillota bacterium]
MKNISAFDSLGPIMVGPSSSHTAGAVKIGLIGNKLANNKITSTKFYLHGSFAKTYKGHGTDKALLGGILGFNEKNSKLKKAFEIADKNNLKYEFIPKDLGDVHPNSVLMDIETEKGENIEIQGSSIGGGAIIITSLNGLETEFSGENPTILTYHKDQPGVVAKLTTILAKYNLNISYMKVLRKEGTDMANMVIEVDNPFEESLKNEIATKIDAIENLYMI